jgi:uncharacterized protein YggU (UPF0235/DUF167 family)
MSFRSYAASPFALTKDGLRVLVRLTPRASRDAFEGVTEIEDGAQALKAKVRAAPERGAANEALLSLAARTLGVPSSRVRLESGAASRLKTLVIEGAGTASAELLGKMR